MATKKQRLGERAVPKRATTGAITPQPDLAPLPCLLGRASYELRILASSGADAVLGR